MLIEIAPFQLEVDNTTIAGTCLWALALYLGFSSVREWVTDQLHRWFNFAERSLYFNTTEFEKTRSGRESQNAFWASVLSIMPFLLVGGGCHYGIALSLGPSWAVSVGILAAVGIGIFELGRRAG